MTNTPNQPGTFSGASGFETVKIDDTTSGQTDKAAQVASQVTDQAKQVTGEAVDQAKQVASEVADQAKQTVVQVTDQARERVSTQVAFQKDRAAESLGTVAQALRKTGDQLRDQQQDSPVHGYITQAADRVEQLSGYLHNRDVGQLVGDVEQFARRQPTLFVGGAIALGVLAARFLKSSGQATRSSGGGQYSRSYGTSGSSYTYTGGPSYGASDAQYGQSSGTTSYGSGGSNLGGTTGGTTSYGTGSNLGGTTGGTTSYGGGSNLGGTTGGTTSYGGGTTSYGGAGDSGTGSTKK